MTSNSSTECVRFAREAGYRRMVLWTHDPPAAARRIYLAAGFRLVEEEPRHSFGVDLVGQRYALELSPVADPASGASGRVAG